jgi:hypothetical protein
MSHPRNLILAALTTVAALAGAAPASAATQQLAGVLEDGRVVRFTAKVPIALSTPIRPRGLQLRERLLAIAGHRGALIGLGSAARLYRIDPVTGRATALAGGRTLTQGLRGSRFSVAIAADGARARILSDVGQDVTVDLTTGVETPGPGLRTAEGTPLRPAVTMGAEDRLVGVDLVRATVVRENDPATGTSTTVPLVRRRQGAPGAGEPSSMALGTDGRGYVSATLGARGRVRQSQLLSVDLATGQVREATSYFLRRIDAIAALGEVADDRTPPRTSITVPRRMSVRRLAANGRLPITVRSNEAGQAIFSLRVGEDDRIGFGFTSRDTPGAFQQISLFVNARDRTLLRRSVGRRARLVITVNDFAGNGRSVIRPTRLVR